MVREQWQPHDLYRPWLHERPPLGPDTVQHDPLARFHQPHDARLQDFHDRPLDVARALRDHCRIPVKHYFLAAFCEDGTVKEFSGPVPFDSQIRRKFFHQENFLQCVQRPHSAVMCPDPDFAFEPDFRPGRRRNDRFGYPDDSFYGQKTGRKRLRVNGMERLRGDDDQDTPIPVVSAKREIRIGNDEEVKEYYAQQFKNLQQTACKLIAKAWVKTVEPKKQSLHPYTGSEGSAPDWWPKPWGNTKEERVRHKEPDHLYKRERVHLLCHILRMVVEPNEQQHKDIQKLNLNVEKLTEVAHEALTGFFADKDSNNLPKKTHLVQLMHMAKQEERFKRGEIDPDAKFFVAKDDRSQQEYVDEADMGELKDEEDQRISPPKPAGPMSQPMHAPIHQSMGTGQSPTHNEINSASFMSDALPVRNTPYPPTLSELRPGEHTFMDDNSLAVASQGPLPMPATTHDSRRSSVFQSPTDYQASSTTPGIYTPAWPGGTAAQTAQPMYSFSHQPNQQPSFVPQSVPSTQPPYIQAPFDAMHPRYDPNPANIFNTGGVGQGGVPQQQPDYNYISADPRSVPGPPVKVDPSLSRGPLA